MAGGRCALAGIGIRGGAFFGGAALAAPVRAVLGSLARIGDDVILGTVDFTHLFLHARGIPALVRDDAGHDGDMHPFRAAVEAGQFSDIPAMCAEDVVFRSPIAHKPYVGRDMLGVILGAVSRVFEDLAYVREIGGPDDADHALVFTARVGELEINGCDFLHTGPDGLIDEFTVMLRPLKAVNAFAEKMSAEFAKATAAMSEGAR